MINIYLEYDMVEVDTDIKPPGCFWKMLNGTGRVASSSLPEFLTHLNKTEGWQVVNMTDTRILLVREALLEAREGTSRYG